MTITNGSDLRLILELEDYKGIPLRVNDCKSFSLRVFTTDKNKFISFDKETVEVKEDRDEVHIPSHYLSALDSGVIQYVYSYKTEEDYAKNKEVFTDFYWKNIAPVSVAPSEEGINTVSLDEFNKFKEEVNEHITDSIERINTLEEESPKHTHKDENSLVFEEDEIISELYVVDTLEGEPCFYTKEETDEIVNTINERIDEEVESIGTYIDETYVRKDEFESEIQALDNYYTKEDVDNAIESIDVTDQLSEYAKRNEVTILKSTVDELYNELYVDDSIDIITSSNKDEYLTDYVKKNDLPNMGDYLSKTEAERYYLQEHQDLSAYLTESDADRMYATKDEIKDVQKVDLKPYLRTEDLQTILLPYAKKESIPDVSKCLTEHQSLDGYYTKEEVDEIINDIDVTDQLTEYAKKEEITVIRDLTDKIYDELFVDELTDIVTNENIDEFLVDYAKKADIPTKLSDFVDDCGFGNNKPQDLSNYVEHGYLEKKYYDKDECDDRFIIRDEFLKLYYSKQEIDSMFLTSDKLDEYVDNKSFDELKKAFESHNDNLSLYALKQDTYTKEQINGMISGLEVDLTPYAKKEDIPDVSRFLTKHQSLDNYYTKAQTDAKYLTKHQSLDEYAKKTELSNYVKRVELPDFSQYLTQHQSLANYAKKDEIPDVSRFITEHQDLSDYAKKNDLVDFITDARLSRDYARIDYVTTYAYSKPQIDLQYDVLKHHLEDRIDSKIDKDTIYDDSQIKVRLAILESIDHNKFLTEHSLCDYWTAEEVQEAILKASMSGTTNGNIDLSIYLKKGEASSLYQPKGDYVTKQEIEGNINMQEITEQEIRNLL